MFQRILVPLDGSQRAERALPVAARLAHASGGSVILVQALSLDIDLYLVPQPTLIEMAVDAERACAEKYLKGVATSVTLDGVPTEMVVLFGPAAFTILSIAHSYQADLIVLCSHGYTGMKRWVMGSVAQKVAQYASVPVLVLREDGPLPAGFHPDATRPLRVLVPLDGSAQAKAAIEPAASVIAALAAPAQGALHLTRVVKPSKTDTEEGDQARLENILHKAKEYLSATAAHLHEGIIAPSVAAHKLAVTWSVAVDTDVAEGAGVFGGCDMIAMATHGRGGMQRWVMGSITERVLGATKLPLLIIRPSDTTDKTEAIRDKTTGNALKV